MNYLQIVLTVATLSASFLNFAQFGFEFDPSIPVMRNGDTLVNPWGGGLNYPQFSDFDYDFDGDLDLFVFDRSSNNVRVYTQEGTTEKYYQLAYGAASDFPAGLRYRATLIDYDGDGRKDLFTANLSGVKVYRNVGDQVNGLQWDLAKSLLYTDYLGVQEILGISVGDIPAIVDVDFDGDIDILTFNSLGNRIEYHQNQSMDLYGIPDSLVFELRNECWGKFTENDNNNGVVLNNPNSPCVGGNIPNPERNQNQNEAAKGGKHVGSTILALDIDSSGVLDLLIGDAAYSSLSLLTNGGTTVNSDSPMISVEYNFPTNSVPIKITLFPASYFIDVDFDGVKDLIAAPNALNISYNEKSVKFYKNIGTNGNPIFVYASGNFLQSEMIEHGTGSVPMLFDANDDGLKDLIVANFFRFKPVSDKESTIAYYRNVGTSTNPVYEYVDYDYLNLSQESYGLSTTPAFGDLDGDGDEDLLLATSSGTLVYYENESIGSGAVWGTPTLNFQDNTGSVIFVGEKAHPTFFDLNEDGLLDLTIGRKQGNIEYYENVGSSTNPAFELVNDNLGNVNISNVGADGYATPEFIEANGEIHLFVGNYDGTLVYFDSIQNNLAPGNNFRLRSNNYLGINVGRYSTFFVEDLDADGNLNMLVGQDLGGVFHFQADPLSSVSLNEISYKSEVAVYPNPTNEKITISSSERIENYSLQDMKGQRLMEEESLQLKEEIDLHYLPKGIYVLTVELENGALITKKIVKE